MKGSLGREGVQYQTISSDPDQLLSMHLTWSLSNRIKISRANRCYATGFRHTEQDLSWTCVPGELHRCESAGVENCQASDT